MLVLRVSDFFGVDFPMVQALSVLPRMRPLFFVRCLIDLDFDICFQSEVSFLRRKGKV